jgi:hypothetical protein
LTLTFFPVSLEVPHTSRRIDQCRPTSDIHRRMEVQLASVKEKINSYEQRTVEISRVCTRAMQSDGRVISRVCLKTALLDLFV